MIGSIDCLCTMSQLPRNKHSWIVVLAFIRLLCLSSCQGRRLGVTSHVFSSLETQHKVLSHPKLRNLHLYAPDEYVENAYLVKFDSELSIPEFQAISRKVLSKCQSTELLFTYMSGFNAIAVGNVTYNDLDYILAEPTVLFAERDGIVHADSVQSGLNENHWGLDRVDQKHCMLCDDSSSTTWDGLSTKYRYDLTGAGVRAYVIDSGIQSAHNEFITKKEDGTITSRVSCGLNLRHDLQESCEDEWGHGTHVASLLGGKTYGVAKGVELIAIKVFGADGSSRFANIIAGIEHVVEQKKRYPFQAMLINLSLGTSHVAEVLNEAVNYASLAGIPVITAAGNGGVNACSTSPASAEFAITVGATTSNDTMFTNGNWGSCVDIFAPGAKIRGAWIGDTFDNEKTLSGTSMASPYVAGAVALYLEFNPHADLERVRNTLLMNAIRDVIRNSTGMQEAFDTSPNVLLNVQHMFISSAPSMSPQTSVPTTQPTRIPSLVPSITPTLVPTTQPSQRPSLVPSITPTFAPSEQPSQVPSKVPSSIPSVIPSSRPSNDPSSVPTMIASSVPSTVQQMNSMKVLNDRLVGWTKDTNLPPS